MKKKYIAKPFSDEVRRSIFQAQNGYYKNCLNPIHSTHHKLPNSAPNRAKYPLFLNSPMNGVGLCLNCHKNKAHLFKITTQEADVYERWLVKLMVNMPFASDEANGIRYQKIGRGL